MSLGRIGKCLMVCSHTVISNSKESERTTVTFSIRDGSGTIWRDPVKAWKNTNSIIPFMRSSEAGKMILNKDTYRYIENTRK